MSAPFPSRAQIPLGTAINAPAFFTFAQFAVAVPFPSAYGQTRIALSNPGPAVTITAQTTIGVAAASGSISASSVADGSYGGAGSTGESRWPTWATGVIAGVGGAIVLTAIGIIAFCLLSRRRRANHDLAARQARLSMLHSPLDPFADGSIGEKPYAGSMASIQRGPPKPTVHNSFFGLGAVPAAPPMSSRGSVDGHRRSHSAAFAPAFATSVAGSRRGSSPGNGPSHGRSMSSGGAPLTAEALAILEARKAASPTGSRQGSEVGSRRLRSPAKPWAQPLAARSSLDRLVEENGQPVKPRWAYQESEGSGHTMIQQRMQSRASQISLPLGQRASMRSSMSDVEASDDFHSAEDEAGTERAHSRQRSGQFTGY